MTAPTLENNRVKLIPLDLSNYKQLITIAKENDLIYYSPNTISTPETLRDYVQSVIKNPEKRSKN